MGLAVAPPRAGRLPPAERAGQDALQLAERVHRRLVAWRWMALRFPGTYRDAEGALAESRRLNEWIETVLATRPSGRVFEAAAAGDDGAEPAGAGKGGGGRRGRGAPERSGAAAPPRSGKGRRTGRRAGAGRTR
jgi:ATP-dependent RNA helicase SUPV3L1/SUV3